MGRCLLSVVEIIYWALLTTRMFRCFVCLAGRVLLYLRGSVRTTVRVFASNCVDNKQKGD